MPRWPASGSAASSGRLIRRWSRSCGTAGSSCPAATIRWKAATSCCLSPARTWRPSYPGCCTRGTRRLPDLGDLRPALERVGHAVALRLDLLLDRLPGFLGQLDVQRLTRWLRVVAADDHHVGEDLLKRPGQLGLLRRG